MKKINKNTIGVVAATTAAVVIPSLAFAQDEGLTGLLGNIQGWLSQLSVLLFALATLTFFWGMIKFIWSGDKEEGKTIMVWGILALFVMFSVWAIVKFLQTSTGTDGEQALDAPIVPGLPNQQA